MAKFAVEKGVPIPEKVGRLRQSRYPFDECEVGDSFFVPCPKAEQGRQRKRVMSAASRWRRATSQSWMFVADYASQDDMHGVRVWRRT